ncbi:MAG: hypothetical protein FD548_000041 [Pelagibacterales bacterium]|nr:hypothetical protein [Pelagibacterales bacterium]
MIKKIILFFLVIFLLENCGYTPIFSTNNSGFNILEIKTSGENQINFNIKNNLKNYKNLSNKEKNYRLEITSTRNLIVSSKDNKGNPKIFTLIVVVQLNIFKNDLSIATKTFTENFNFKNTSNKFDLKKYEKNTEKTLVRNISEKIISYLHSL